MDEQTLEVAWQQDYPYIFAGVLDAFSVALRQLPEIKLSHKQRMADYQLLGEATARGQGQRPGYFSKLYADAVGEGTDRSLETYGIANALQVFMAPPRKTWSGTFLELMSELNLLPGVDRSHWPKSPRGLAHQLKRITPGLRRRGVLVKNLGHSRRGSRVQLSFLTSEKG